MPIHDVGYRRWDGDVSQRLAALDGGGWSRDPPGLEEPLAATDAVLCLVAGRRDRDWVSSSTSSRWSIRIDNRGIS